MKKIASCILLSSALLLACQGGSSKGGASSTGTLTDAAIAGVPYTTSSGRAGVTSATGTYDYTVGDTVTFNIGGIKLALPAVERVTPSVIAKALYPSDPAAASNATINLANLFQTLDGDGIPDNGIAIPSTLVITGFDSNRLDDAPADFATALNSNDSITPGDKVAKSPSDAVAHLYGNELPGTWYLETAGRLLTITIDSPDDVSPRYVIAEIDKLSTDGDSTGVETGIVDVESSGKVVLVALDATANTRSPASCPVVYGEQYADEVVVTGTGTELKLVDDKLELTMPACGSVASAKVVLSRLKSVKGSMVGTWLEDGLINQQGNAIFGRRVLAPAAQMEAPAAAATTELNLDDIFQIYFADKFIQVVLDCEGQKCGTDERNGLIYAGYTFVSNNITVGDVISDKVSVGTDKVITKGEVIPTLAAEENDTRRGFDGSVDAGELIHFDRLLPVFELQGDFKPGTVIKQAHSAGN